MTHDHSSNILNIATTGCISLSLRMWVYVATMQYLLDWESINIDWFSKNQRLCDTQWAQAAVRCHRHSQRCCYWCCCRSFFYYSRLHNAFQCCAACEHCSVLFTTMVREGSGQNMWLNFQTATAHVSFDGEMDLSNSMDFKHFSMHIFYRLLARSRLLPFFLLFLLLLLCCC